ncbi:hypothetical protein [Acidovorax sp.]|uniref:hypothetical protein n=1 Tax=Acidovorax sp. TaxID=1872122 RepID=UPI0025BA8836|nr:hypothetical protein [Acidovorax sp.]MBW8463398.1 hypothetical protein [Acidovorax sp.]
MRKFVVALFVLSAAALCLCVYCFLQIPFDKVSTEFAISEVERTFVVRMSFDAKQLEHLDWLAGWIRMNTAAFKSVHRNLWQASVYGFGAFGLLNAALGFLMWRALRANEFRKSQQG